MTKQRSKIEPRNNKNYQITKSGAFMLKNWTCFFESTLYKACTISTDIMNFEIILN